MTELTQLQETLADVVERLAAMETENARLHAQLLALQSSSESAATDARPVPSAAPTAVSRRHLLRGAGTAAAAGAGLLVVSSLRARPAGADPGQPGWQSGGGGASLDRGDAIEVGMQNVGDPNDATLLLVDAENNLVLGAVNGPASSSTIAGNNRVALYGRTDSATNGRGIYGHAPGAGAGNVGVYGHARSQTGLAGQNAGVCGDSKEAMGVVGLSTQNTSVFGLNNGTGIAVFGYATGTERGVLGRVDNSASNAAGVHGLTNGSGDGVLGESRRQFSGDPGNGVHGFARGSGSGVLGRNDSTGFAVFGYQTGTGRALLGRVDNPNSTAAAAHGTTNGKGTAVLGEITNITNGAHAVHGLTDGTGNAVFGESTSAGSRGNGVLGIANGPGNSVYGFKHPNVPGDAVVGWARSGSGAFGLSDTGVGVKAQGGRAALLLVPRGGSGPPPGSVHDQGELATDTKGGLWLCTARGDSGDGGVPTWVRVVTSGDNQLGGATVRLRSTGDRAARFESPVAQVQLAPADRGRPSSGKAGDLFVDKNHNLWFCKGGKRWAQLA